MKLKYLLIMAVFACAAHAPAEEWTNLFDKNLTQFEVFIGIPHTSVQGLPEGTLQSEKVTKGTPLGLNNDLKHVFSMVEEDGVPVLHVSGEIYGGLTTLKEYENYHLSLQMKWGEKKWEPRLNQPRDSGILYHCHGEHGFFWKVWKASVEFQVQESDLGDLFPLGTRTEVRSSLPEVMPPGVPRNQQRRVFDPASEEYGGGTVMATPEADMPLGEWNLFEIYAVGDQSVHVVNGKIVMVVESIGTKAGVALTKGQIQIQSEGAECYYKEMRIAPITEFPEAISKHIRLKSAGQSKKI